MTSSTWTRFSIVVLIVAMLAIPVALIIWKSNARSPQDHLAKAKIQLASGKTEQARLGYEQAVNAAESPQERRVILREVAAAYRSAEAKSSTEALQNYTAAIAAESKILQEVPGDADAGNNTLDFYAAMFDAYGVGSVNPDQVVRLCVAILKEDPGNEKAAVLMVRSHTARWRYQANRSLSRKVIEQQLKPAMFCLKTSLQSCQDLITLLYTSAMTDTVNGNGLRELAQELIDGFSGDVEAQFFLGEMQQLLESGEALHKQYQRLDALSKKAIAIAPTLANPVLAKSWFALITRDRRLEWDGKNLQARGDLAAMRFASALPPALAEDAVLAHDLLALTWRLNPQDAAATIDTLLAQPRSGQAGPQLLRQSARAIGAALIRVEIIVSGDEDTANKLAQLDDLAKRFSNAVGGESLLAHIELMKHVLRQWHHTAGANLLKRGQQGDFTAMYWAALSLQSAGARDTAYPIMRALVESPRAVLPGRYQWKLLQLIGQYEAGYGQAQATRKRLDAITIADDVSFSVVTEARLAAELSEILMLAKRGKQVEARAMLAALQAKLKTAGFRDSALLQATNAAILAETGDTAQSLAILETIPISPTVVLLWPGLEGGHAHAWSQLKDRVATATATHPNAIFRRVAKQLSQHADVSRMELAALLAVNGRTADSEHQPSLLRLLLSLGRHAEVQALLQKAEQQTPKPAWLASYGLSVALQSGDWPAVAAVLADKDVIRHIDPIQLAYVEAAILLRQEKLDGASSLVEEQLERCSFHQGLWVLKGRLAEQDADWKEAEDAYKKALALNRSSTSAIQALHRVFIAQANYAAAGQLMAAQSLRSGRIADLVDLSAADGGEKASKIVAALEAQQDRGELPASLELQLMVLQWRLGQQDDAKKTAASLLARYPDRLSFILPALAYGSDPDAVTRLKVYRQQVKRPLAVPELLAIANFWRVRGYGAREGELLAEAVAAAGSSSLAARNRADWLLRSGQTTEALALLEKTWAQDASVGIGLQLVEVAIMAKKRDRALAVLAELAASNHTLSRIHLLKAYIQHPDDPQTTVAIVTAYIATEPQDPWGWYYRAKMQVNDPEAAGQIPSDLQQALKLAPEMEQARLLLADWMLKHGDAEGAARLLESGSRYSPGSARLGMAEVVSKIRDLNGSGACEKMETLLQRFPRAALIQRFAVYTFMKFGRYHRCLPLIEQFLADAPDSVIELNNAAHVLAITGEEPKRALVLIEKALGLVKKDSPYRPYLEDTRTVVFIADGRYQDALTQIGDLHAPHQPAHCLYLAVACLELGRTDDAAKLIAAAQAAPIAQKQSSEWHLAVADLGPFISSRSGKALLPALKEAAMTAEEHTGSPEVAARAFAALAAAEDAAGSQRAAVLSTLRRSSSIAENPWAAVLRASLLAKDGKSVKTKTAISDAQSLLAQEPIPILLKRLADIQSSLK